MRAVLQRHIESDYENALGPKLNGQVDRLKTRMTATWTNAAANNAGLTNQYVRSSLQRNLLDVLVNPADRGRRRELKTCELASTVVRYPPAFVEAVQSIGPWGQTPSRFDDEDLATTPRNLKRLVCSARTSPDYNRRLTFPVRPHHPSTCISIRTSVPSM